MAVANKTLGRWAVVFGVLGSVFAIKKAINKKSEKLENFDKNHKLSSFAIDLTAMYAGLNLTLALFDKASKKIKEKFPKAVENFKTRTLQPLKNVMDRSKINKVLVKKLDKTINKNIYNKTAINTSLKLVTPVIMFSGFFRYIAEAVRANKEVQENYTVLKTLTNEKFLFEHK